MCVNDVYVLEGSTVWCHHTDKGDIRNNWHFNTPQSAAHRSVVALRNILCSLRSWHEMHALYFNQPQSISVLSLSVLTFNALLNCRPHRCLPGYTGPTHNNFSQTSSDGVKSWVCPSAVWHYSTFLVLASCKYWSSMTWTLSATNSCSLQHQSGSSKPGRQ